MTERYGFDNVFGQRRGRGPLTRREARVLDEPPSARRQREAKELVGSLIEQVKRGKKPEEARVDQLMFVLADSAADGDAQSLDAGYMALVDLMDELPETASWAEWRGRFWGISQFVASAHVALTGEEI